MKSLRGAKLGSYAVTSQALVIFFVVAAAFAGNSVSGLGTRGLVVMIAGIICTIVGGIILGFAGTRGIVTLFMLGGFGTLGMTNVRVTDYAAVSDVFFLGAAAVLIASSMTFHTVFRLSTLERSLLVGNTLLIAGSLIGSTLSPQINQSISEFPRLAIAVGAIPLLILLWSPTRTELLWMSGMFVSSASISALVAVIVGPPDRYNTRAFGLATHPNSLALISILALGPAVATAIIGKGLARWIMLAISGLLVWCVLFSSGSRSGAIGMGVMFLALLLAVRRAVAIRILIVAFIVGIILIYAGNLHLSDSESINRLIGSTNGNASSSAAQSNVTRLVALREAWHDFLKRPFVGVGLYRSGAAINAYVSVFVTSGILGLLGLWLVLQKVVRVGRTLSRVIVSDNMLLITVGLGWVAGYMGMMAANLFQNAIWERYVWVAPVIVVLVVQQLQDSKVAATSQEELDRTVVQEMRLEQSLR